MPTLRGRFISSVRRGTGEAILLLERHPRLAVDDVIYAACISNFAYDPQCEGDRAEYALRLILTSRHSDRIVQRVRRSFAQRHVCNWDLVQLFALAGMLSAKGYPDFKALAFRYYSRIKEPWDDWGCGENLVAAFGEEALFHVAAAIGACVKNDPGISVDDVLVRAFYEAYPRSDGMESLIRQAERDPNIRLYLTRLEQTLTERRNATRRFGRDLAFYRARIESGPLGLRIWGASKENMAIVAALIKDFNSEADPARLKRYTWLLSNYRITGGKEKLMSLLKDCDEREEAAVLDALSHFKDERLRSIALEGFKDEPRPGKYLPLLNKNYRPGDAHLLFRLVRSRHTPDEVHDLVGLVDVYRHNVVREAVRPLTELYERLTCGIHRYDVIKALKKVGGLDERIRQELSFDSFDEIRGFKA